jgi:hypothetical protein
VLDLLAGEVERRGLVVGPLCEHLCEHPCGHGLRARTHPRADVPARPC